MDAATLDLIDAAPSMPGSRADALGLKPGDDKFAAVNLVTRGFSSGLPRSLALVPWTMNW